MQLFAIAALLGRDLFNCVGVGITGEELLDHFIEQLLSIDHLLYNGLSHTIYLYVNLYALLVHEGKKFSVMM